MNPQRQESRKKNAHGLLCLRGQLGTLGLYRDPRTCTSSWARSVDSLARSHVRPCWAAPVQCSVGGAVACSSCRLTNRCSSLWGCSADERLGLGQGRLGDQGMAACAWQGTWRRLGLLLVLALLVSELAVFADAAGKKKKTKATKKTKGPKKKGSNNRADSVTDMSEKAIGVEELDHLARGVEKKIGGKLSKLAGMSGHASSALPKPTSVVPQEAIMVALLQAKLELSGTAFTSTPGGKTRAPDVRNAGATDSDGNSGGALMVFAENGWHPVALGLVGNWTRHGFRCHGHARDDAHEPNESLTTGYGGVNNTLAECQTACRKLRWCHYYSYRADVSDTAVDSRGGGRCEFYSAHPVPISQVLGSQLSVADDSIDHAGQSTSGGVNSDGSESRSTVERDLGTPIQVDRCVVDLSGCSHPDTPDSSCLYTAGESAADQRAAAAQKVFGGQQAERAIKPTPAEELALAASMTQKERLAATLAHFGTFHRRRK
eukprot:COSAG02_NODE_703_length_18313_cov_58.533652_4_plen_489_part_00